MTTPNSTIVILHGPCDICGSSDARTTYGDGHSYCHACPDKESAYTAGTLEAHSSLFSYEYLSWRGIHKETFAFYDVKTKIDEAGKPVSMGFRYPNENYKIRSIDKKDFWSEKGKPVVGLFGSNKFAAGGHDSVTITEGELDALSLWQCTKKPTVSVQSASTAVRDCIAARSWLNEYERIYLAFDNDAVGADAVRAVAKLFDYGKVFVVKFSNRKDANEYVRHGESDQLKSLWSHAKRYLPDSIKSSLDDFRKILKVKPALGVPYPFKQLTKMTYGIRGGESVLITAQEKVGKTELMHFIEHQLLKETEENVGAIYLEEPEDRHLRALCGIEIGKPVHLPDCEVAEDVVEAALSAVVKKDDRLHLYSHFGSVDAEHLLDEIRFLVSARNCRYILLDHLTMVNSGNSDADERRAIDFITTRLEMMVKELQFALIVVSHVNDNGQTRGSRYPTKVFDITITATRDLQALNLEERNTIQLRVLFNRYCSHTGPAGRIQFHPETYSFTEESQDDYEARSNAQAVEDGAKLLEHILKAGPRLGAGANL